METDNIEAAPSLQLGGNIELSGFSGIDFATMIVLKKIVGNHAKRFSEICPKFEKLHLNLKKVHHTEGSDKFEISGTVVDNGKHYNAESTDRNLFMTIDQVLKKIESEIKK